MVKCDQTAVLATLIMCCREEVQRLLQKPVQLPHTREVQDENHIDRSVGGVFARWRWLGIPSLAQLARSQDKRVTMPLDPHRRMSEKHETQSGGLSRHNSTTGEQR